jgi:hypothetical protein
MRKRIFAVATAALLGAATMTQRPWAAFWPAAGSALFLRFRSRLRSIRSVHRTLWLLRRSLPLPPVTARITATLCFRGAAVFVSFQPKRPRSCGCEKSSTGPIGTMPVGFTLRWLP